VRKGEGEKKSAETRICVEIYMVFLSRLFIFETKKSQLTKSNMNLLFVFTCSL
jgi:hypothetical protein